MSQRRSSALRCALLSLVLLAGASLMLAGCPKKEEIQAKAGAQVHVPAWHCAMHPSYVSDHPGQCPICGMDLVPTDPPRSEDPGAPARAAGSGKVVFYRSPMNPSQISPVPRKDEMGMDYVPVYPDEVAPAANSPAGLAPITIDSRRQQLIGLRTAAVRRAPLSGSLRTTGRVTFDERRLFQVHTRYEAYIEHLYANFTGKYVERGAPLLSLYSPDLLSAQQEYLLALRSPQAGVGANLADSARERLLLWGVRQADIEALEKTGKPRRTLDLYAPGPGFILAKTAIQGRRVMPEDALFDIADLSQMWVLADIYEHEYVRVHLGQTATLTLPYWPGRSWQARVSYIFPVVDPKTRTIKVRLEVDNPKNELKVDMFATVIIATAPRTVLTVPEDAVLETGTRRVVFVSLGEGRLQPREIETGECAGGLCEVKSGLKEDEQVAAGASFLIDSESRLQAALSAMAPKATSPVPAPKAASPVPVPVSVPVSVDAGSP